MIFTYDIRCVIKTSYCQNKTTLHYDDVTMGAIASQITSLTIVYSTVYSVADQSKHQSSASLAFVWGIHRGPVNSPHKWPVTRKMLPFDDVIMVIENHSTWHEIVRIGWDMFVPGRCCSLLTHEIKYVHRTIIFFYLCILRMYCKMDVLEWNFMNFDWNFMAFVPCGPFNNIPALVQIMAWHRPGDKPLSKPMLVSLLTPICVTRPQWVNCWCHRNSGNHCSHLTYEPFP